MKLFRLIKLFFKYIILELRSYNVIVYGPYGSQVVKGDSGYSVFNMYRYQIELYIQRECTVEFASESEKLKYDSDTDGLKKINEELRW